MPFAYRRFPVQCAVTYHAGQFLTLPLAVKGAVIIYRLPGPVDGGIGPRH